MSLIRSAARAGKVVKNVGRLREIVTTMARFGFGALVQRTGLGRFVDPLSRRDETGTIYSTPVRLRLLFEELGPTFIKIGQILGGRPDLIPPDFVTELQKLQDSTQTLSITEIRPLIEAEIQGPLEKCFSSFDTEALASASIAQVHAARTLQGEDVVVKIQKPDVEKKLYQDLEILEILAFGIEKAIPELKIFRPVAVVEEFKRILLEETDFRHEATNILQFRKNFSGSDFLVIPRVYSELSTRKLLVLERLRGVKLSQFESFQSLGISPAEVLRKGMDAFFKSIMVDGFFHGDPHPGNILVLPDGRMGLLDFGSVGKLSRKSRMSIINMFLALLAEDYDALVWEYVQISPAISGQGRSTSRLDQMSRDVAALYTPYHGLPLKDIPSGKLLMEATGVAFRNNIVLPADLVLVFKAVMTLEGIGRLLDPNFDLVGAATKYSTILIKERYNPKRITKDLLFFVRDLSRLLRIAPRQMGETLRQLESGEFRLNFRIVDLEKYSRSQSAGASKISLSIVAVGLLLCSAYVASNDAVPIWAQLSLWTASLSVSGLVVLRSLR